MNKLIINICLAAALSLSANASTLPDLTDDTASDFQEDLDITEAIQQAVENFSGPDGLKTIAMKFYSKEMKLSIRLDSNYNEDEYCAAFNTLSNLEGITSLKSVIITDVNPTGDAALALANFLKVIHRTIRIFRK